MTPASRVRMVFVIAATSLVLFQSAIASAQSETSSPVANADGATAAPSKADRKAAKKQARAKKNAELKKLEDAGYKPGARDDSNYPQDIQDAQKKAGIGQPQQ
ncbi:MULTISPECIES: DUF4148 domain-containing protein [unclassified Caballeronia]|uniref:DUF4148 domain-containing protein n=1 Tax=unclassified Caballeronia TaxID=2646786 RepID=UPI00285FB0D1|nr:MULTISPECIES: DUF4148 domain-containing protein [unclassified Caballeronia]MDR5752447.1 DUF4148 domain-containing protein [Caballeronia sp. LZ024]MDR5845253.1 DUF4148 domain-containing protein [Caballeronia sp. LZ031]